MKQRQLFRIVAAIALIFGWAWAYQLLFREQFYTWAKALPFGLGFPVAALIFLAGFAMLWTGGALIYRSIFGDAA